jgi:hypothetical protein
MTAALVFTIEVDVALARPPRADATRRVLVAVDPWTSDFAAANEAALVASQMAQSHPGVVMAVGTRQVGEPRLVP